MLLKYDFSIPYDLNKLIEKQARALNLDQDWKIRVLMSYLTFQHARVFSMPNRDLIYLCEPSEEANSMCEVYGIKNYDFLGPYAYKEFCSLLLVLLNPH